MNQKSYTRVLLAFAFVGVVGCKKFVEIQPPATQLVTASVFNNNSTATSALLSIYTQMFNNMESYNMSANCGLLSDELTNYSNNVPQTLFYQNSMTAIQTIGPWTNAYSYIYQANAIIEALTNNASLSPGVVKQLTGESLFVRAFWHFYLANCYGDVPLVTTSAYNVNATISRTAKSQVYQQIITDLLKAQGLLSANYVDASDTTVTTERVRPTSLAAAALLARVYLYEGDYSDAKTQATAVINNSQFSLDTVNGVFLANNTEAIWQIATPLPTQLNTYDAFYFILLAAPGNTTGGSTTISTQLMNSFEPGDLRRANWIDSVSNGGQPYYFPFKYKVYQSTSVTEYTTVLRLAEQFLIRAEAETQLNDLPDAITDLNKIRSRAGLGPVSPSTQSGALAAIMQEREVELFTEWGHRWFDLIRTGSVNTVMGGTTGVCAAKGGSWSSTDTLFPVPQIERSSDPNLSQNPGY
jgi:hypothetical protein